MIADLNNMPHMFWECNRLYFNHKLPTPKFDVMHTYRKLGKFAYRWGEKKKPFKKRFMVILMSDYFDFDEETFRNIMVHEMIHYYLAWNRIKTKKDHGKEFMEIAQDLNVKYGLNVTKTLDASSFQRTEQAPKAKGFWQWLLW